MAAGDTTQGRRLPDGAGIDEVTDPGDYLLLPGRDAVWCVLPNGVVNRIPVSETGTTDQPVQWGMTEHEDGTLTLSPSINLHPTSGIHGGWHGFLERGVWREV
jgi:hypothetical protein